LGNSWDFCFKDRKEKGHAEADVAFLHWIRAAQASDCIQTLETILRW